MAATSYIKADAASGTDRNKCRSAASSRLLDRKWFPPAVVFLVAFAARLIYWLDYRNSRIGYLDSDAADYLRCATWLSRNWHAFFTSYSWHQWYGWIKAPLYYIFLAIIETFAGDNYPVIRFVQVLMDCFTAVFIFFLTKELFDRRAALFAGIAYAIYFEFVIMPCSLVAENLFVFLLVPTFWLFLLAARKKSPKLSATAGAMAGLTALCRPVILPFMPFAAVWLAYVLRKEGESWGRSVKLVSALAVATTAVVLPWAARNSILMRQPFGLDNIGTLNLMLSHAYPELDEHGIGPGTHLENRGRYKKNIWNWDSTRNEYPLSAGRILQVTFELSARNLKTKISKAQQLVHPMLTRLYYNYPAEKRFPCAPPSSGIAMVSDILFMSGWLFILTGIVLKTDRRNMLIAAWIVLQIVFLTVIFRPTPNHHMRRYSIPFMALMLPFIHAGIHAASERHGKRRLFCAALVIAAWFALLVPPMIRWFLGHEIWIPTGVEMTL